MRCSGTRQNNPELGECARRSIDIYDAAMLFHDDVMAHRQTKSGAFTRRLGREKGVEYLLLCFAIKQRACFKVSAFHGAIWCSWGSMGLAIGGAARRSRR
jgi:hypothetical protein